MAPVACRCKLCRLDAPDGDNGALELEIQYGGPKYGDEGNELCALWRRMYVCRACVKILAKGLKEL